MIKKINLEEYIRNIPDFPKPGILFRDVSTLIQEDKAFSASIDMLAEKFKGKAIDKIAAVEARGFIFGAALAYRLKTGFIPIRKKGKLPFKSTSVTYDLEYGTDTLEIHTDAVKKGERILIVDDLLATGGTVKAAADLILRLKGKIIGVAFIIELFDLNGRDRLKGFDVYSLIKFPGH